MNRKLLIAELYVLSILGKNHKKDSLIKRSGLFKSYGGGTGIPIGFLRILN